MVWKTTQPAALYEAERCCSERIAHTENVREKRTDSHRRSSQNNNQKSLFDDGDTLLLMVLLYILVKEKSDQTLILSLLIAMLM